MKFLLQNAVLSILCPCLIEKGPLINKKYLEHLREKRANKDQV